jgi:hypothetical protein
VFHFSISSLGQRKARTLKFAKCACELILQQDFQTRQRVMFFLFIHLLLCARENRFWAARSNADQNWKARWIKYMSNSNHGQPFESKIYFGKSSAHVILLWSSDVKLGLLAQKQIHGQGICSCAAIYHTRHDIYNNWIKKLSRFLYSLCDQVWKTKTRHNILYIRHLIQNKDRKLNHMKSS